MSTDPEDYDEGTPVRFLCIKHWAARPEVLRDYQTHCNTRVTRESRVTLPESNLYFPRGTALGHEAGSFCASIPGIYPGYYFYGDPRNGTRHHAERVVTGTTNWSGVVTSTLLPGKTFESIGMLGEVSIIRSSVFSSRQCGSDVKRVTAEGLWSTNAAGCSELGMQIQGHWIKDRPRRVFSDQGVQIGAPAQQPARIQHPASLNGH